MSQKIPQDVPKTPNIGLFFYTRLSLPEPPKRSRLGARAVAAAPCLHRPSPRRSERRLAALRGSTRGGGGAPWAIPGGSGGSMGGPWGGYGGGPWGKPWGEPEGGGECQSRRVAKERWRRISRRRCSR